MKLRHNLSHSFWQVLVVTAALASLQRNEEYQTRQQEALAGMKDLCNIAALPRKIMMRIFSLPNAEFPRKVLSILE